MPKELNLLDFLIIFAKEKYIIIFSGLIIGIVGFIMLSFAPQSYKATVIFAPKGSSSSGLLSLIGNNMGDLIGEAPFSKRQYIEILNSRSIREELVEKFNLIDYYQQHKNEINPLDFTLKLLHKDITIDEVEEGGLGITDILSISIEVINQDPQQAADMANCLLSLLEQRVIEIYSQSYKGTVAFLDHQIEETSEDLNKANFALKEFQLTHKIFDLDKQVELSLNVYSINLAEISALEKQIQLLSLTQANSSAAILLLRNRITYIKQENTDIEKKDYGTIFPGLQTSLELAGEYTKLITQSKFLTQLHLMLIQQRAEVQIKIERDYSSIYIIDSARAPEYKFKPKRVKILLFCLIAWYAFLVPILVIRNMYSLTSDDTRRKIQELKNALRL